MSWFSCFASPKCLTCFSVCTASVVFLNGPLIIKYYSILFLQLIIVLSQHKFHLNIYNSDNKIMLWTNGNEKNTNDYSKHEQHGIQFPYNIWKDIIINHWSKVSNCGHIVEALSDLWILLGLVLTDLILDIRLTSIFSWRLLSMAFLV